MGARLYNKLSPLISWVTNYLSFARHVENKEKIIMIVLRMG